MISQGMLRMQVKNPDPLCPAALSTWMAALRVDEVLHYLDISYWPFARAIATQLRADGITKTQQVAYLLFAHNKNNPSASCLEGEGAAILPSSIN
eukprot:14796305-Heterocapsa_arctica.AAC.2